jgi:hypothetical protein
MFRDMPSSHAWWLLFQRSFDSWVAFFDRFSYLLLSFPNGYDCVCASARPSIANDLVISSPRRQ